ncbi:MAG: YbjN domain-containing protein [Clostridia bacterium]|nr:YbjN domain-containing protein [Clostridia bacterium]
MSTVSANKIYQTLLEALDNHDFKYARHDDKLAINATITTEDLPVEFIIRVIEDAEVIQFRSVLPIKFPENKRVEGAIVTQIANYGMINGSFDYDIRDGEVAFRLTTSYTDTELSDELIWDMIGVAFSTTDKYNDRFFMVAKNVMTVEQFIEAEE